MWSGLFLFLAVLLVYQPVWHAGFIWDDDTLVTGNPALLDWQGLRAIWTTKAADICPLTLTTFWIEHALWGFNPLPYHLLTVILHGACAVVFGHVLKNLRVPGPWLGAALWAFHPVQVESVAWIAETKNTQSGLFFLLALLFFVKWLKEGESGRAVLRRRYYLLTLMGAVLAMTSKSSTVILPVILLLCAWRIEGRWWSRRVLTGLLPLLIIALATGAASMWTQSFGLVAQFDPQWVRSWPQRFAAAGDATGFYLAKLVCPWPLMTVYPRWKIEPERWFTFLPLVAVIGTYLLLWLKRARWPGPFFAAACFGVALLPGLGLADNTIFRYSLVFDHFQYLASIAPLALVGAGLASGISAARDRRPAWHLAVVSLLVVMAAASWSRAWVYRDQISLWSDELAKNPDCWVGYNDLGLALFQSGAVDAAENSLRSALQLNPHFALAHNNLGNIFINQQRLPEAQAQFEAALVIQPSYAEAHGNLGVALAEQGRLPEAIAQFREALRLDPTYGAAKRNLQHALSVGEK